MQRIIHRQVTAIQITSIEVLWDEDRHPFPHEPVDAAIVAPALPEPRPRRRRKSKPSSGRKSKSRKSKPSPPPAPAPREFVILDHPLEIQE